MSEIAEGASAISTFGLYAIVSALAICVIYLYKRTVTLEKEFREYIAKSNEQAAELQKGLLEKTTVALNTSSQTLGEVNDVMQQIALVLRERKHD